MPFEHSNKRVAVEILVLVAGAALLVSCGVWGLRKAVELSVEHVPASVDQTLGDAMASALNRAEKPCESAQAQKALVSLAAGLVEKAGMDAARVDVRVLDSDAVNAFALPGGHIYVFSGLLREAHNADEVAGVLAHELGHVALRHHLRGAVQSLGLGAATSALLGDVSALTTGVVGGSSALLSRAFSRESEEAADAYAVQLAASAGYAPAAMGELLERMEQQSIAVPSLLRTHPSGPDRRRRLEALAVEVKERPPATAPTVSMGDLRHCHAAPE